jgi:hypothetical protein
MDAVNYRSHTIYTIGHSTRSAEEFLELLQPAGVTLVADVRAFPSSRRHPQFNGPALAEYLRGAGIGYRHLPGLGGRRSPVPVSPNGGWHETAFQGYADHMATPEFQRALADLEAPSRETPTAIMCAEAVWWRCHRRLIADALVVRGQCSARTEPSPIHPSRSPSRGSLHPVRMMRSGTRPDQLGSGRDSGRQSRPTLPTEVKYGSQRRSVRPDRRGRDRIPGGRADEG